MLAAGTASGVPAGLVGQNRIGCKLAQHGACVRRRARFWNIDPDNDLFFAQSTD
jgi:hypothetical protein